ncbi:hypothetical protein MMC29_004459 [Sticta canariensis]|nr:hypothetical protein [Sticta canariensis]
MFLRLLGVIIVALSLSRVLAGTKLNGVNIAGFDFGCETDGHCYHKGVTPPLLTSNGRKMDINRFQFYADGPGQMQHFVKKHGMNVFRLPVAWQFLVNYKVGGPLHTKNFGLYDDLVQACLKTGSYCMIDIHNYGRYDGEIVGQGGPTNQQFASLWWQLGSKYRKQKKVMMGLMNEPHDLDMDKWTTTVQKAVIAIRKAGATSQLILLPGTKYTSAKDFHKNCAPNLSKVKDLDGSVNKLIFDVHKYYDDGKGHCRTDLIDDVYRPLVKYLRKHHRKAFISETGGGSGYSKCIPSVCRGLKYIHQNADVFLGITGWSAGAFSSKTYDLTLTPDGSAKHGWKDQKILTQCFVPMWKTTTPRRPHKRVAELDAAIEEEDEILAPRDAIADPDPSPTLMLRLRTSMRSKIWSSQPDGPTGRARQLKEGKSNET